MARQMGRFFANRYPEKVFDTGEYFFQRRTFVIALSLRLGILSTELLLLKVMSVLVSRDISEYPTYRAKMLKDTMD